MSELALDPQVALGLTREQLPRHIAVIMDGNGRWAMERGLPRLAGHERGAESVRVIVTHCARLGIEVLTLYSFSTENWRRPKQEVDFLMDLYARHLISERDTIMGNNIRFLHLGRREGLPANVLDEMDNTVAQSQGHTGLTLCLALNYGARTEIVATVRRLARDVQEGKLSEGQIDEDLLSGLLYTGGLPDPDLLIRTAGEYRVSNFLLWQISYAEIYVSDALWPDFGEESLNVALRAFATRERRFGGAVESPGDD